MRLVFRDENGRSRTAGPLQLIPELEAEFAPAGPESFLSPRELTYTTRDVIDERISIPAQHSLVRLSKNPATNGDALGMLAEVKAGRLAGIYCVNWRRPAQRALRLGSNWWSVIPQGKNGILLLDPDNQMGGAPMIAFRRTMDPECGLLQNEKRVPAMPGQLDAALLRLWQTYRLFRRGRLRVCPPVLSRAFSAGSPATRGEKFDTYPPCCMNATPPPGTACQGPVCTAAGMDLTRLEESISWLNNALREEPGNHERIRAAKEVVKTNARQIELELDYYISTGCCHPHLRNLECQVRSLPWPSVDEIPAVRDRLLESVRAAQRKAMNDYIHC